VITFFSWEDPRRVLRFKVPQNIDIQDRILGPLTMVQFIYAVVGGGLCYAAFIAIPSPFSFIFIVPIALFVTALIFLKINERPFLDFMVSIIEFSSTPKQRIWQHSNNLPDLKLEIYEIKKDHGSQVQTKRISKQEMSEFAKKLDQGEMK
jgi:hypothetical protein